MRDREFKYLIAFVAVIGAIFAVTNQPTVLAKDLQPASPCHQYYPNVPGKILLENDKVVVQRFTFQPGQWEGVHSHPAGQIYIHIKGGDWTVRYGSSKETSKSKTGSVGWYGPVPLSADHESVNSGDQPIDLIWVTLKSECMKKN